MRYRLLCCAAILATACVKRVAPTPPDDRSTVTGVPLPFGERAELPEGSQVLWDFGDGTPPVAGAQVDHAYRKAGVYTIVETIQDKDGKSRTSRTHVAVVQRTLPMAVPADVRAALFLPTPWNKIALHRELAGKLSLGAFFDEVARTVSEAVGFDAKDAQAAEANGFDKEKGLAFFTVPQDPEALILAAGTLDDAKALEAARKLLQSEKAVGRYGGGAFKLTESKLPDGTPVTLGQNAAGDKVAILQRFGYLYIRTAGASDPLVSLRTAAALPPDKGLAFDAGFANAIKHIGTTGDAVFYSRAADGAGGMKYSSELGASAFAIFEKAEVLQLRFYSQLRNVTGDQLAADFTPLKEPPDLASKLPAGASAYLRISAAPEKLWRELSRMSGADTTRLRDRIQESTGLDLEKDLIPSFAGNVSIGVYLDASSLVEAIMGEDVSSFDKSAFVIAAQLVSPDAIKAVLEKAMKSRPAGDRAELAGASVYRLGDAAFAALKGDVFFLALGGAPPPPPPPPPAKGKKKKAPPPPAKKALTLADLGTLGRVLQPPENTLSMSQEFKRIGIAGFQVPGQQNVWVNIAQLVRSIEHAGQEQGGVASSAARLFADRAAALRDVLFEARPGKDGVDADLWIRFLPRKNATSGDASGPR